MGTCWSPQRALRARQKAPKRLSRASHLQYKCDTTPSPAGKRLALNLSQTLGPLGATWGPVAAFRGLSEFFKRPPRGFQEAQAGASKSAQIEHNSVHDYDDDNVNVGASRGPLEARLEPSAGSPSASRGPQEGSKRLSRVPRMQHKFKTAPSQQENGLC